MRVIGMALGLWAATACGTPGQESGSNTDDDTGAEEAAPNATRAACEDYYAALNACAADYAVVVQADPASLQVDDAVCAQVSGGGEVARAQYGCFADVYWDADCSTAEGYTAAAQAATDCAG